MKSQSEALDSAEGNHAGQTFRSFPVRNASFSRKSSGDVQHGTRYVFWIYSGFALSNTAPMCSSGFLIFSTCTCRTNVCIGTNQRKMKLFNAVTDTTHRDTKYLLRLCMPWEFCYAHKYFIWTLYMDTECV